MECGKAHNFSACVTGEQRKAKKGGGQTDGGEGDRGVAGREGEKEQVEEEEGVEEKKEENARRLGPR